MYGKIFYSLNNGQNWTEQTTPISDPIHSISFLNNNKGIAISGNKVLFTSNGGLVGISEINDLTSFVNIYPNPTIDILTVQNNSTQPLRFTLYSSLGELFIDIILTNKTNTIDITTFTNGVYFYNLTLENKTIKSGKVIKQ